MLDSLKREYNRKHLQDEDFAFLFAESPPNEVVCVSCKTTSLDIKQAEILVIAAVIVKNTKIFTSQKLELLVKPQINGLEPTHAIKQFLQFIGSRPVVGYYLEFDIAVINKYVKTLLGIILPNRQIEVSGLYYDKKQSTIPQGNIDLRFDTLSRELDLPVLAGKEDTVNKALMTAIMYLKLQHTERL